MYLRHHAITVIVVVSSDTVLILSADDRKFRVKMPLEYVNKSVKLLFKDIFGKL